MSSPETLKCLNHPKFRQLVRARRGFSMVFSLFIAVGYGIYVLGMAYAPVFMARPLVEGRSTTWGLLIAVLVILSGMICAGAYTWWANRSFDALKRDLLRDLGYKE